MAGAQKLRALTQAPIYMDERDKMLLDMLDMQAKWLGVETPPRAEVDVEANDSTVLKLGDSSFQILQTPGHTPGSLSVWIAAENKLIAGDTLFRDSIGRTDLPGGNSRQILSSIKTRLLPLPDDTLVIPGHGQNTTIGREKERNPFLTEALIGFSLPELSRLLEDATDQLFCVDEALRDQLNIHGRLAQLTHTLTIHAVLPTSTRASVMQSIVTASRPRSRPIMNS